MQSHLKPIRDAIVDGQLPFSLIVQGVKGDPFREVSRHPKLIILGDDLEKAKGPKGFSRKALRAVIGKADRIMIHAAKPSADEYGAAVEAARVGFLTVIIETQITHEQEWLSYVLRKAPKANILMVSPNADRYRGVAGTA